MKNYYIRTADWSGDEEVSETEYLSLVGDETHAPYAAEVYRGSITLDSVPEEYRETVAAIVANRTARWGDWADRQVDSASQLADLLLGEVEPMRRNDVKVLRRIIESSAQATSANRTDDENIRASVLYSKWTEGRHAKGEIYNADGQTWECYADYDNAVHPDIIPGSRAWFAFNRPLHGKTRDSARPWVAPTNAEDIYRKGEWMVWTDGSYCECVADPGTNYSPEEYPGGWRKEG